MPSCNLHVPCHRCLQHCMKAHQGWQCRAAVHAQVYSANDVIFNVPSRPFKRIIQNSLLPSSAWLPHLGAP